MTGVLALLLVMSAYGAEAATGCAVQRGTYQAVTESEWSVELKLGRGGRAKITVESWEAGEYRARVAKRTVATWSCEESRVTVSYGGLADHFQYSEHLAYEEFGFSGDGPGLLALPPISDRSKIAGTTLWRLPMKTGSPLTEPSNYTVNPAAGGRRPPRCGVERSPAAGYGGR